VGWCWWVVPLRQYLWDLQKKPEGTGTGTPHRPRRPRQSRGRIPDHWQGKARPQPRCRWRRRHQGQRRWWTLSGSVTADTETHHGAKKVMGLARAKHSLHVSSCESKGAAGCVTVAHRCKHAAAPLAHLVGQDGLTQGTGASTRGPGALHAVLGSTATFNLKLTATHSKCIVTRQQ
jgi:hypothetical protein